MKKTFWKFGFTAVILIAMLLFGTISAFAMTHTKDIWTFRDCDTCLDCAEIVKCSTNASGDIEIELPRPMPYNGICSIASYAFENCTNITSVEGDSYHTIGQGIFAGCENLTNITLSGTTPYYSIDNCIIEARRKALIAGCKTSIIPTDGSVTRIDSEAFLNLKSLNFINIPNTIVSMGSSVFEGCDNLSYNIHGNGKYLGNESNPYHALIKVTTTSIDSFEVHPDTVVIAEDAFEGCDDLVRVAIPSGVKFLGSATFAGCTNLLYNNYGNAQYLGNDQNPYQLLVRATSESITSCDVHPKTVSICESAFSNCKNLTGVVLPDSIIYICESAFSNCKKLTGIVLPDSIIYIGDSAFYSCESLLDITLPQSVTRIERYTFMYCNSLRDIAILAANASLPEPYTGGHVWEPIDYFPIPESAILYGHEGSTAQAYAEKNGRVFKTLDEFAVKDWVLTLNATGTEYSVTGYEGTATEVVIPSTYKGLPVTSIGDEAFYYCGSLTSIEIPSSVTSIGESAFDACRGLTSISIPDSVTSIGDLAFEGCDSLTSITFGENSQLTSIGYFTFAGCNSLTSITIPASVTSIGDEAFYYCGSLTSISIPDSVTSIGDWAFEGCDSLTSITIPASVTSIGVGAFLDCRSLTSVTIESPTIDLSMASLGEIEIVYGYAGSTAEAFAEECGATFVSLGWYNIEYALNADGQSYTLTAYIGTDKELIVPLTTLGLPITHFAKFDFPIMENDEITHTGSGAVVMPEDSFDQQTFVEKITFMSKTIVIEDDAQTIPESVTICGYANSTAQAYAEKYGREFIILPEIASANIALGSDITVNYLAYLDDSQKDAVMQFTVNGVTTTVAGVATATPNRYQFSFTGINPQMMGDNIAVELVLNGETLAEMGTYSVKQYCVNMKSRVANKSITGFSDAQYAALDTLLADILEYGAAAQNYKGYNTGNLVNAGIAGASEFIPLTTAHKMPAFNASTMPDEASFTAAKVVLSNAIQLRFEFKTTNVSRVTIKVGDRVYDKDDFTLEYSVSDGFGIVSEVHSLSSDAIFADQMETSYTVILCVDGVECQRLQYSVVNYIYNMQNTTSDPNLVALLKRIRNYGLSAVAYRNAK